MSYLRPRPLAPTDDVTTFTSRGGFATIWLNFQGQEAVEIHTASAFVVTEAGSNVILAFYAWSFVNVAPPLGAYRVPESNALDGLYVLLSPLGVDFRHEDRGLKAGILADAIVRFLVLAESTGIKGLIINVLSNDERAFYNYLLPGLHPSPTSPDHLLLLTSDATTTIRS